MKNTTKTAAAKTAKTSPKKEQTNTARKAAKTKPAKAATKKSATAKPSKDTKPKSKGKLGALLGYSVISVMRAMGKHGWDFDQTKAALDKAGITAATHTIKMALKRGRDGQKKIAPLSASDLEPLRADAPAKQAKKSKKTEAPVAA